MSIDIARIESAAGQIRQKLESGELISGCCMSAAQTPVREAWDLAEELTENDSLSAEQKQQLFARLDREIQSQLAATGYDDFDLVYERLLQLSDI